MKSYRKITLKRLRFKKYNYKCQTFQKEINIQINKFKKCRKVWTKF